MRRGTHNLYKPYSFYKQNPVINVNVKLLVLLLLSLAIFFLFFQFIDSSSSISRTQMSLVFNSQENDLLTTENGFASRKSTNQLNKDEAKPKCDLFEGAWIPDLSPPLYNNNSCPFMESHQNCLSNGRPDLGYLFWRWKPRDCELPKFNPLMFLHLVRNKSWAFIGDSISRNHVQSLLCILSRVEQAKQISPKEESKSRTWIFPSYNFTIAVIWSPFLVKADIFEGDNGVATSEVQLHLDKLDEKWTSQYKDFDYVIFSGGKWFLKSAIYHEENTIQGCHYCHDKNVTELGFDYAYSKALEHVFKFITSSSHKPLVFFRTITPDHFENGDWSSGGTCPRRGPFKDGVVKLSEVDRILHEVDMQEFNKAVSKGSEEVANLKLLNTTQLSLLRPDGHPGPFRQPFAGQNYEKVQNDCLHWCLPGPIDSWNDLLMEILIHS